MLPSLAELEVPPPAPPADPVRPPLAPALPPLCDSDEPPAPPARAQPAPVRGVDELEQETEAAVIPTATMNNKDGGRCTGRVGMHALDLVSGHSRSENLKFLVAGRRRKRGLGRQRA